MTEQEILDSLKHIEIRTGKERTIKSYVLRSSTLDEAQKQIVLSGFERYCTIFRDELTDPKTLFKDPSKPVIVEIGFGMGTSTQIIAKERADYNYLCLEVYLVGFVKLLRDIEKLSLDGGDLKVEGTVNALIYEPQGRERGGLLSRLLGG